MPKKHIIIISIMFIIGIGFFLTTWILSHRVSIDSNRVSVDSNDKDEILNITKTLNAPNHYSTPKEKKEVVLKEKTQANSTEGMPKTADHSQDEEFQNEEIQEFLDSLISQTESQNDEVSKGEEKAVKYEYREKLKIDNYNNARN